MIYISRGSEFRKWDLHVHSPASFEQSFGSIDEENNEKTWDAYIDQLEKVNDVAVIAITDYFTIDGYKRVLEYRDRGRLQNFNRILPNIEFRLDTIIPSRHSEQGKRLNYHVIFSDEINPEIIERDFIRQINFKTHQGESLSLCRENIEKEGCILKLHQDEFKSKSDYVVGCCSIAVNFDQIKEILEQKKSLFEGKYIFVLPEELWESLDWKKGQSNLTRKKFYYNTHAIFASNPSTIEWALGKKADSVESFIQEFGSLKPCIHGSDAHAIDKICRPDNNRYCWIKADTTFEGLKQILYEPNERVKIQEKNPDPRKNIYSISSFGIGNANIKSDLEIEKFSLKLNKNLISIIGGKGDGKTAFLDLIANCFEDRSKRNCHDENSFIIRIEEQKPDFETKVTFSIGETFCKNVLDQKYHSKSKITYLPQKHFEEYSSNGEKLQKKIVDIIFSTAEIKESRYTQEYLNIIESLKSTHDKIKLLNSDIYRLEDETAPKIIIELKKKLELKKGELANKEDQINMLKKNSKTISGIDVDSLKGKENNLKDEKLRLEGIRADCISINEDIENLSKLNLKINSANEKIKKNNINIKINPIKIDDQIDSISILLKSLDSAIQEKEIAVSKIGDEINKLSGMEKDQATFISEKETILNDISIINAECKKLKHKKECIKEKEDLRISEYRSIFQILDKLDASYEQIISAFSEEKDKILNNVDFKSYKLFNKRDFISKGEDVLDLRSFSTQQIEDLSDYLNNILTMKDCNTDWILKYVKKINSIRSDSPYKSMRTNLDFYNWVFGDYFLIIIKVLFNSVSMEKLSMGQKATVLLKLFLAEGDNPLIIDQPEENLDNKYIYESLVDAFRDAKKKRQIIIATHNANLVVNTDSEQIIISEYKDGKITYTSGSIEDKMIKKNITALLEGGEEAFKRRELRYGI